MAVRGEAAWWLSLILGLCTWLGAAHAQVVASDDERGRKHFEAGASYYELGRYAEAAREFHEAFDLSGRPEMLLNVSRAHEHAGELHDAVLALELLLERYPQTSYRAEAEAVLARLRPLDRAPAVAAPALELAPVPQRAARPPESAPSQEPRLWPPSTLTLALGGSALATGIVSLAVGVRAHRMHQGLEQRCQDALCSPSERDQLDHGQRLARTSTGLTFAALALASATAVFWVLDVRRERARPRLALGVGRGSCHAQLRWEL
jgi:tetratricopeptide (TPR) repeat protein